MKKYCLLFVVGIIFLFSESLFVDDMRDKHPDPEFSYLEEYLIHAEIGPLGKKFGGRRENYLVNLDYQGERRQGLISFTDRQRGKSLFQPLPDSYRYVIAAYELDKLLGGNMVWPVVEREYMGRKAGLQIFIEERFITELTRRRREIKPPDPVSFRNQMEEIMIFSALVYSDWRPDLGDILILVERNWRIIRVDLSEAFHPVPGSLLDYRINGCSKRLYHNLRNMDDSRIKETLAPYLNSIEIDALLTRKEIILDKINELIERLGEENVLFEDT